MKRTNSSAWVAAVVLGIEAVGVLALGGWEVVALVSGDAQSLANSLALIVLTAIGAVAVASFAVGTARARSWGRSGGIVTQLLVLAVAVGAFTGAYAHPGIGLALTAVAVVGLVPLVLAVRTSAREDEREDGKERERHDTSDHDTSDHDTSDDGRTSGRSH